MSELATDMATPVGGGPPPDTTPPGAPASLTATASSATQVDLAWPAATDNVAVTGYRLERCTGAGCTTFAEIATPTGLTASDPGRTASTTYRYQVRASDAAGNLGAYSPIATVTTPAAADTTPPGAPASLTATASSATQVDLAWPAATDNVAVTGYRLERCTGAGCTTFAEIATPTGLTASDPGRTASTTYRYQVRASDAAGNLGAYSPIATRDHPGRRRHDPARRAGQPDRDRELGHPGRSGLAGRDRQRGGHRLSPRALHRRRLHDLRRDRHADRSHRVRPRPDGLDHVPLPGPRQRCRGQPRRLLADRDA